MGVFGWIQVSRVSSTNRAAELPFVLTKEAATLYAAKPLSGAVKLGWRIGSSRIVRPDRWDGGSSASRSFPEGESDRDPNENSQR